jgi:rhomboid family GlyGly-CTERM serine protease
MKPAANDDSIVRREAPAASLLMAAAAMAAFLVPWGGALFEYDRAAIEAGELWRVLSCHFTHFSPDVLVWDLSAFVFLGAACERRGRLSFLTCVAASAMVIPCVLWIVMPGLEHYRGLSGIATALFGLLAVTLLRDSLSAQHHWRSALILLFVILFVLKTALESASGIAVFADQGKGVVPVPLAHITGAVMGVLTALIVRPGESAAISKWRP